MICIKPSNELIDELSDLMFNWWGREEGWSIEKIKEYVKHSCLSDRLPMTFVYYVEGHLAGFCQLTLQDVDVRPDLYPWFINMYVKEEYRGRKICASLVNEALSKAKELGYKHIYLYTLIEGLYERFGYHRLNDFKTYDNNLTYMLYKKEF